MQVGELSQKERGADLLEKQNQKKGPVLNDVPVLIHLGISGPFLKFEETNGVGVLSSKLGAEA